MEPIRLTLFGLSCPFIEAISDHAASALAEGLPRPCDFRSQVDHKATFRPQRDPPCHRRYLPLAVFERDNRENGHRSDVVVRLKERIAAIVHRLDIKLSRDGFEIRPCQSDSPAHFDKSVSRTLMRSIAGFAESGKHHLRALQTQRQDDDIVLLLV